MRPIINPAKFADFCASYFPYLHGKQGYYNLKPQIVKKNSVFFRIKPLKTPVFINHRKVILPLGGVRSKTGREVILPSGGGDHEVVREIPQSKKSQEFRKNQIILPRPAGPPPPKGESLLFSP